MYNTGITDNPLLLPFDTPYGVPPFDLIRDHHYKPALEEAMAIHKKEIDDITKNPNPPDFSNTVEALDKSGRLLHEVSAIFYNLLYAESNENLDRISEDLSPLLARHQDYIALNTELFARVRSVWDHTDKRTLSEEQWELLDKTYKSFTRNGALLSPSDKEKIRAINEELALLSLKFGQNVLGDSNEYRLVIDDESDLAGLPQDVVTAAAGVAESEGLAGKWVFTLQNPSVMPFLHYAENRMLRRQIWHAMQNKGNNGNACDNNQLAVKIANLRLERAKLLGYDSHAHYVLEEQMASTPEKVMELLDKLWKPAVNKAKKEAEELSKMISDEGGEFPLAPYDWRYLAEKQKKQQYDLDENELRPYFSLQNAVHGIFICAEKLYGLSFVARPDLPVYHPEVTVYEVREAMGTVTGILYMDFHPRKGKRSGAWMTSYRQQSTENGRRIIPLISIVCNFSRPASDAPSLLTLDEVNTLFHEFGHALHGLLSDVRYKSLAGTSVPTDFVELPSQIMENWATEPEVLGLYAHHYQTGQPMPGSLTEKIDKAAKYGQGFASTEYLAASLLDMAYHTITQPLTQSASAFEEHTLQSRHLIPEIIPRYRTTYFNHIFAWGYSAGYYSYIWSEVLDSDAYEAFKEKGIFDTDTATAFRKNILERGGSADPMELYRRFRGQDPAIHPLLIKRGLSGE